MTRRLLVGLAVGVLVIAQTGLTPARAQDVGGLGGSSATSSGGYGADTGASGSSGAASSQSGSTTQAPAVNVPAVQTPTITNAPSNGQGQGTSGGLQQRAQQYLQQQQQNAGQPQNQNQAAQQPATPQNVRQKNQFQTFIAESTGQQLPMFGYDLFRGAPSTFAPVENIPVTPDYVIGPGDQLIIRAWGQLDVNYRATVDRNGMVDIPKVGMVEVAGIPYRNITGVIKTAVSRNFRNFHLLVTMGQLRSIRIYVVGDAARPGSYTVSSLSTLVNAVFAVGGPSSHGSMRNIELKRGNKVIAHLDLYDLLLHGDKSQDAPLLPGDVIYFPPVGPLVAISGSVNTPAIYELKGRTSVGDLIRMAGGLSVTAQTQQVTLERIVHRKARISDVFALNSAGRDRTLHDGDLLSVYSISPKFDDVVTLRGHVAAPLRYPYHPGMRIDDLIPNKDALITPDYYLRQNLATRVQSLGAGALAKSVRQLASEINWNYAVIERQNPRDLSTELIPFNLGKAVLDHDPTQNLPLEPGDVVTVFSKKDVHAPAEQQPIVVTLAGEFQHAGVYQAKPGETLRQLVMRVGGLTSDAYLYGSDFTRESTKLEEEKRLKQVVLELQQDLQAAAVNRASAATSTADITAAQEQTKAQEALLRRLESVTPTGRIVLNLHPGATVASLPPLALEDGDRFFVPQQPSMVSVYGTVFNQSSFLYVPDKTVSDYLREAGGARKNADKSSIYVIKANGAVVSNQESGWLSSAVNGMRVMPGDAIVVPQEFDKYAFRRGLRDWTQIVYQLGLGAAAIHVLSK